MWIMDITEREKKKMESPKTLPSFNFVPITHIFAIKIERKSSTVIKSDQNKIIKFKINKHYKQSCAIKMILELGLAHCCTLR